VPNGYMLFEILVVLYLMELMIFSKCRVCSFLHKRIHHILLDLERCIGPLFIFTYHILCEWPTKKCTYSHGFLYSLNQIKKQQAMKYECIAYCYLPLIYISKIDSTNYYTD